VTFGTGVTQVSPVSVWAHQWKTVKLPWTSSLGGWGEQKRQQRKHGTK